MKKLIISVLFISFIFVFIGCNKEEEQPDYVGKWGALSINYGLIGRDTLNLFEYKEVYTVNKNTFEHTYSIKYDDIFVIFYKEIGDLVVDEKNEIFSFIINKIGESGINSSYKFTGQLTETDYSSIDESLRTFKYSYYLNDTELTILYDDANNDGDYYDFGEYQSFLKLD